MPRRQRSISNSLHRPPPLIVEPAPASCVIPSHRHLRHPSREETTRVELQRQRLEEYHAAIVVSQRIPGLKTSTAFFASLRTNLRLNASPPLSPLLTPTAARHWSYFPPPPSPLVDIITAETIGANSVTNMASSRTVAPAAAAAASTADVKDDPLAGLPELKTYMATSDDDQTAALRLIADSAAQMRQTANSALLVHPLNLSIGLAALAGLGHSVYTASRGDLTILATTLTGVLMGALLVARWATQGHLSAAERLDSDWLAANSDDLLVTRFGEEIIGALALVWLPMSPETVGASNSSSWGCGSSSVNVSGSGTSNSFSSSSSPPTTTTPLSSSSSTTTRRKKGATKGEVRAWTVRLKYRGKGVGGALLEEAAREARRRGAEGVWFADVHANSTRVLPRLYNGTFDKREARAREALRDAVATTSPGRNRRKRGGSS